MQFGGYGERKTEGGQLALDADRFSRWLVLGDLFIQDHDYLTLVSTSLLEFSDSAYSDIRDKSI